MIGIVILGINLIIIQTIKTLMVKIRKLSVTCSLSDPKDYKGGELEFQFRNRDDPTPTRPCLEILPRGSIVVFPSFVWHRVKPVTEGTRYSLVIWNLGYPFR
jgi:PKHD-type hydroxylase